MVNPVLHQTDGLLAYQQVLDYFALTDLLHRLNTYCNTAGVTLEPQEAETLAAILIQILTANLTDDLLASYINASCHSKLDAANFLTSLELPLPSTDLPANFPDVEVPRFLYGDRLRWISDGETTDRGIVIGRFYSFAPHRCRWNWCYLIWLDPDSPSSAWISADTAWESDLEPLETEEAR